MVWLTVICSIILIIVTSEVLLWSFTLNRHAWWIKTHPKEDKRNINYKSLFYNSTFTAIISIITLFVWIYLVIMGCACHAMLLPLLFIIALGGSMVIICYLSLIAKLCRLDKYYYPPLTVKLCKWYKQWVS